VTGWGGTDIIFEDFVSRLKPKVAIEVGSWKGQSAITMAEACKKLKVDCAIICVDTWLGSEEHILRCSKELKRVYGYPTLYLQFLSNVVRRGVQDIIVPLPTTSLTAASVIANLRIKADLIYIDANHQYEAALADLAAFSPLLAEGGVMFGHDYSWESRNGPQNSDSDLS
jgi:predicted O-methyltransferase YrrM